MNGKYSKIHNRNCYETQNSSSNFPSYDITY